MENGEERTRLSPGNFILPQTFSFYSPRFIHTFVRLAWGALFQPAARRGKYSKEAEKQKRAFSFLNALDAPTGRPLPPLSVSVSVVRGKIYIHGCAWPQETARIKPHRALDPKLFTTVEKSSYATDKTWLRRCVYPRCFSPPLPFPSLFLFSSFYLLLLLG